MERFDNPHDALRHHVTGAIERGEATAIPALPMTLPEMRAHILDNPALRTNKEKAAALYGAVAAIAFSGEIARAKEFAALCGVSFAL